MLGVIVREQWRRTGALLMVLTALAAALPAVSVRVIFGKGVAVEAASLLAGASSVSGWFPLLSLLLGGAVASAAWQADHEGGHVYALSLPIPRWHYALLRLAAGFALLAPAIVAFALSSFIVAAAIELPPGIRSYPVPLIIRFFGTSVVAYTAIFAVSSGTRRQNVWALLAVVAAIAIDVSYQVMSGSDYSPLFEVLLGTRSPLTFFLGQWTLVDV